MYVDNVEVEVKTSRIAFSIDLDDWYHTPLVSGANFSHYNTVEDFFDNWRGRYDYITGPTHQLLDLLDKHNISCTFFIIADQVSRYPEIMKRLKLSKHEIAHHSLHHTIPFDTKTGCLRQTIEEWTKELIYAKYILEEYFEREIIGYRAPGAYLADWMVPILIDNGFKYDSSVVYNSLYSKSNLDSSKLPLTPFKMNKSCEIANEGEEYIFEIPWTSMPLGSFRLPGGGAFFFRLFGVRYFTKMYRRQLEKGDGMFYLHSLDISNEIFPLTNFKKRPFFWLHKGTRTFLKLEKLLLTFPGKFVPCKEMFQND